MATGQVWDAGVLHHHFTTQRHVNTTAACIGRLKAALFVGRGPTLEPGRASAGPRVTREARPATVQAQLCLIE